MPIPRATAESFRELDFHDDTFVDMKVLPAPCRGDGMGSVVEIQLLQYSEKTLRVVRFSGCTNLRVAMDFDVLADNLSPNTSRVDAHTDLGRMRDLIQSQEKDWDVNYAGTSKSPVTKKLATLDDLVFFRVQFFGGVVDIIAREYQVEAANKSLQATAAAPTSCD
jgi:hypothetical protein